MKARQILYVLTIAALLLVACQPERIVETVVVTEVVEVQGTPQVVEKVVERVVTPTPPEPEPAGEKPSPSNRAEVVRMAILSDMDGTNPWYLFDITGSSYWNYVITAGVLYYPQLYTISEQRWDFVPMLADGMPGEFVMEGENYVGTVKLKEGLKWSDGSPLTAEDVAFTANTALLFALSGNWVGYYNPSIMLGAEAVDLLTVEFTYNSMPGIPIWQYGTLIGPIVKKAYWEPLIADVAARAGALDRNAADYLDQITPLQQELEAIPNDGEPTYGPLKFNRWESGAYVENVVNENSFMFGVTVEEYANGAYREYKDDVGYEFSTYGDPSGEKVLELTYGPFFDTVLYPIYSQDAAYLALQNGEVDIVLNPSGVSKGIRDQLSEDPDIQIVRNAQNGFRYIEFNQARPYFSGESGMALRQAIACQIDLEYLANDVLQKEVVPVYTLVPEGLTYYFNPDVPVFCKGMNTEERLNEGVRIMTEAGFSWDTPPSYLSGSAREAGVVYGEGLKLPDGSRFPEVDLQAPAPGYDPKRATAAIYIEQWMRILGVPVTAVYTPFNTIRANENSGEFDIIMLGWGLDPFPSYLCDFFTGATGVGDGSDNIGYVSPALNETCTEFYAATDLEQARQLAFELQEILATELPYITLFTNPIYDAYSNSIAYPYTEVFDGIQGIYGGSYLVMPGAQD
ncbi:MAG TPA: ABC transporter substrate-binding protein [Anaerolineales bacterium]|nr:ABC transporter substrate-binding protein [Anaerolineales bacterium]